MDVRVIHYFIGVFEERSFTKAAERMHVVQSALSMQIRNLEEELKTPLFQRAQRGLEPTIAGRRFYELCVPIARSIAAAKQELVELAQGTSVTGSMRIGLTSSMCQNVLGNVLGDFHALYPQVEIMVTEAYARDITDLVQAGELDVGLGALPLDNNSLSCRLGFTDEYVLVSGHPINGPTMTSCDLSMMKDLTLVIPSDRHLLGTTMRGHIASGRISPKSVVTIDGMVATLESVRSSDWGAICLMNSVVDKLDNPETYIYPITNPRTVFDLYLLHDLRKPLTAASRIFIEMFEKRLNEVRTLWSSASSSITVRSSMVEHRTH
jgi:DNA-binding transcriptional LysR family regulator